ncbi:acyloxyacyl hydrolase [Ramlibacter sp. AN1015]|uniref:acyloxyacyl hydrolase n=1 Tax=Ramlibacter sp. AN1015 TaxID=3133428 RepID=UPI0030BC0B53
MDQATRSGWRIALAAAVLASASTSAAAQVAAPAAAPPLDVAPAGGEAASGWRPQGYFIEWGRSRRDTDIASLGVRWPWRWQTTAWGGRFTAATELSLGLWRAETPDGRESQGHVALVPLLRWRGAEGASPWFVEGGIGLSLHQRRYRAQDITMSTRWNFYDTLAVGRTFASGDELSLRALHVSNAGIRKPNPGADIVLLRWARPF